MMDRLNSLGDMPVVVLPVVFFLLLLAIEQVFPLRTRTRSRPGRWGVNLVLTALVFAAAGWLLRPVVSSLTGAVLKNECGLMCRLGFPPAPAAVVGFLLMDLTFYWWHRANHAIPFLWRLHNVHHIDPDVDVTTSFRFHFVEIILSIGFRVVQVLVLGITPTVYATYELFFTLGTMFHHSNLRLPLWLERPLNFILVTPRMHGIHHSAWRDETNSNYSVLFRLWDTLHRTLRLDVPQADVECGVPGYSGRRDNSLFTLLTMPFRGQREYWQKDGSARESRKIQGAGGGNRMAR
ncbi:MAG: sterol desaturase family protein [Candidatus Glassbacteria bacterium]|nr:sterol desaturase family protein [Candidatus Glassbacteria bacterium]